jgi:hypothetical protein
VAPWSLIFIINSWSVHTEIGRSGYNAHIGIVSSKSDRQFLVQFGCLWFAIYERGMCNGDSTNHLLSWLWRNPTTNKQTNQMFISTVIKLYNIAKRIYNITNVSFIQHMLCIHHSYIIDYILINIDIRQGLKW